MVDTFGVCYTDLKIHVQRIFLQKNKYSVNVWVIPRKLLNLQMIDNEWQKVVESGSDRMGGGIWKRNRLSGARRKPCLRNEELNGERRPRLTQEYFSIDYE